MWKQVLFSCLSVALWQGAHAATVLPQDIVAEATFNWGSGGSSGDPYGNGNDYNQQWGVIGTMNGGTVAITGDFPRNGNGSLRFDANGGLNTKAGVAYYPPYPAGFGPLSSVTAASYDWFRASASDVTDRVPAMRIFLFDPDTGTHVATLNWQPQNDAIAVTSDVWVAGDVLGGNVWNSKANSAPLYVIPFSNQRSFAQLQTDSVFGRLQVRAVELGFGSGDLGPNFVGAADNVVFAGSSARVADNFEFSAPMPAVLPMPTPVPSLGEWTLMLLSGLVGGLALCKQRFARRA